jgi:hypothetical protein
VSAPDELNTDRLPELMSSVREMVNSARRSREYHRAGAGARAVVPARPPVDLYWVVLVASVLAVFGLCYFVGRTHHGGGSPAGEAPSTLQAAAVTAGIPPGLGNAPPIDTNTTLELIAEAGRPVSTRPVERSISIRTAFAKTPETVHPVAAELPSPVAPAPSTPATPAQGQPAPRVEAPKKQPAPQRARRSGSGTSGEGSFDSSG